VSLPAGRPSGRTEANFSNIRQERLEERGEVRAKRSGAREGCQPAADEMDKTLNVSVMEGLNTGIRGNKHL
jgi:hypothetical protein